VHDFTLPYGFDQPDAEGNQAAMQRSFSGEFAIAETHPGTWQIENRLVPHQRILVRGVRTPRPAVPATPTRVSLEWTAGKPVVVTLQGDAGSVALSCDSATSQETNEGLYRALPLAEFTADRQRFWRRVFWLVRIPGGRFLLRLFARRARRTQ
jgi:hypothetical protein